MSHYFINDPNLKSEEFTYQFTLHNQKFILTSDAGVFSNKGLDYGTKTLLENVEILKDTKSILDVGCGIGTIGIVLKKMNSDVNITMIDVNNRALDLAKKNAKNSNVDVEIFESNLYEKVTKKYDLVISNPPIRAGKKVLYALYSDALNHLNPGGSLWIVIRKNHGAKSTFEFLKTLYENVVIKHKDKGFYVISAISK